jgi:hypothetical protein
LAEADRGKLVDIADAQQRGLVRHCSQEHLHQHDIDHGSLVDDEQVTIEWIIFSAPEATALWVRFQQPMDDLGLEAALGSAPGRVRESSRKYYAFGITTFDTGHKRGPAMNGSITP